MIKPWLQRCPLAFNTPHAAIISLGLFIGLCYLPIWIRFLLCQITANGSGSFILTLCLVMVGSVKLWRFWPQLAATHPLIADHWLGDIIIIVGIFLFPFCRFSLWPQALLWLMILGGTAISCWGISFFGRYPAITWAFILSAYPNPGHIFGTLWQTLLPAQVLETAMAGVTTTVLQWLRQPVVVSGPLILFPNHTITVGWGCSGFDMALAMIGASLGLGLYLRFSFARIFQLSCIGIALAFLFNIPRLVLMSLAAVYWGTEAFEFWHSSIGGQIFVGLLFISYYFCVSGLAAQVQNFSRGVNAAGRVSAPSD